MSGKYPQVDQKKTMLDVNAEVLQKWNEIRITDIIYRPRNAGKTFRFLEGPPTANGRQHVGHALTRAVKDSVLRYAYMKGYNITRREGGWDCHGLAVEIEAEKHFGLNSKKEIESLGVDVFNDYCRESVFRYIDEWMICDEKLGYWVDQTKSYVTMRPDYMESEWWAIAELNRKGLLRKDFKIVPYCPRCGTSLSSHEVAQGYEDTKDPSVFVKFREVGNQNRYFLVWTTTPWTLPSNQFLAVNVKMKYVLARVGSEEYYLSADLVGKLLGESAIILEKFSGRDLLGKRYEQIIPLIKETQNVFRVVAGDFVGTDEGTGIVHVAPAFGADDFEIGKSENVSIINPVDTSGRFNSGDLPWNGVFVKDADTDIIVYLKKRGSLFRSEKYLHTYPFCYRCKSPLLYYPLDTWFVLVSKIRDKLVSNNARINWFPEHMKDGRFGNFLEEAKDWALSRNRYWGTPIPIWSCPQGHLEVIGSRAELEKRSGNVPADLHRPFIDKVKFDCHECGKQMTREPYVMDTWFDSGSAPYAAMHYPFEDSFNPAEDIPMDFISEAVDQTRGWFYVLHAIGSLLFNTNTFSNCVVMEFVLDERGKKMSKSQGNSTLSIDLLDKVGADPLRLFLLSSAPWKTKNLDFKVIDELSRKTFQTMSNVYQFYSSNANLDGYHHEMGGKPSELLDRWLISRLNSLVLDCTREMDAYQMHTALKYVQDFIDELSNFYLRLSRSRFWTGKLTEDKKGSYFALHSAISTVTRLLAPFTPFYADYIYWKIDGRMESVHLEPYPAADETLIDQDLENIVRSGQEILEITRRLRQDNRIKGRQPVAEILVIGKISMPDEILESLRADLNSRTVKFITNKERPVSSAVSPVIGKVAPVLKNSVNQFLEYVKSNQQIVLDQVLSNMQVEFHGMKLPADAFDVKTVPTPGYVSARGNHVEEVFLNLTIDSDLVLEGLAREVIRRIQVMRKEMDLDYDEKIDTGIHTDSADLTNSVESFRTKIMEETLSSKLSIVNTETGREWDIDGSRIWIEIKRTKS